MNQVQGILLLAYVFFPTDFSDSFIGPVTFPPCIFVMFMHNCNDSSFTLVHALHGQNPELWFALKCVCEFSRILFPWDLSTLSFLLRATLWDLGAATSQFILVLSWEWGRWKAQALLFLFCFGLISCFTTHSICLGLCSLPKPFRSVLQFVCGDLKLMLPVKRVTPVKRDFLCFTYTFLPGYLWVFISMPQLE